MQNDSSVKSYLTKAENLTETIVFASRWLLAPFYVGLALSIVVLLIKFLFELAHLVVHAFTLSEPEVVVGVLSLVDLALTGSLLIIVILSGYENFVSRIDHEGHKDWPAWMGTIDFSALKLKLLSSIVAISAIQLLKQFMALNKVSDRDLYFLIGIHVVFVVSSVLLALADRIAGHESHGTGADPHSAHKPAGPGHEELHAPGHEPHKPREGEIQIASAQPAPPTAPIEAPASKSGSPRDGKKGHKHA